MHSWTCKPDRGHFFWVGLFQGVLKVSRVVAHVAHADECGRPKNNNNNNNEGREERLASNRVFPLSSEG